MYYKKTEKKQFQRKKNDFKENKYTFTGGILE